VTIAAGDAIRNEQLFQIPRGKKCIGISWTRKGEFKTRHIKRFVSPEVYRKNPPAPSERVKIGRVNPDKGKMVRKGISVGGSLPRPGGTSQAGNKLRVVGLA